MWLSILYAVLLVAYVIAWAISASYGGRIPEAITRIFGLIGLLAAFLAALQKSSLRMYFLFQKLKLRLTPDTTGRWWISARFDGNLSQTAIADVTAHFASKDFRFPTRVETADYHSARVVVDETLVLTLSLETAEISGQELDSFNLISQVMEVSYGHAKQKLERQIIPVLSAIERQLKSTRTSFELDVTFLGNNPFFAVYVSHLRPEQVSDYRVVLHVDGSHPSGVDEKVEISRANVHVTALSTATFSNLATQFVMLSPDLSVLRGHNPHAQVI